MFLDGGERFTDARPEFRGHLTESIQDVLLPCGLGLLVIEDIVAGTALCPQPEDELAAEAGDGTFEDRRASGPFADALNQFRCESRVWRAAHEPKRLVNTLVGHKTEKR